MARDDDTNKGLKDKAREQLVSVAIAGSSIKTKPGRDPSELEDQE